MGNNEPTVDQSDFRIRGSYGLNTYIHCIYIVYLRSIIAQRMLPQTITVMY